MLRSVGPAGRRSIKRSPAVPSAGQRKAYLLVPFVSEHGRENSPGVVYVPPAVARWKACEKFGRYMAVGAAAAAATAAATDDGGAEPFNKLGLKKGNGTVDENPGTGDRTASGTGTNLRLLALAIASASREHDLFCTVGETDPLFGSCLAECFSTALVLVTGEV